jgi:hypothetical protein
MTRITFGVTSKGPENGSPPEGEGEQKEAAAANARHASRSVVNDQLDYCT